MPDRAATRLGHSMEAAMQRTRLTGCTPALHG